MSQRFTFFARLFVALAVLVPCALSASPVHAGGLFLFDRGARALGRGGAFIAAPDDPSALWYNPAGLIESKNQLLLDATLPIVIGDYQRQYPDGSYADPIKARPIPIPIPTAAFSHKLGESFAMGLGVFAPNTLVMAWEKSQNGGRDPAPNRYSLIGLQGSLLANVAAGIATKLGPLQIGVDVQVPIGWFRATNAASACDRVLCGYPEQHDFDATATTSNFPTYGITGTAGVSLDLDAVRFGFSASLPYTLKGTGKINFDLPRNVAFADAQQEGQDSTVRIKFPLILRAAGEMRPLPYLRMEGAFVFEKWSSQKTIDIDVDGVSITNVNGGTDYGVNSIRLQRNMKDVWSLRGGAELEIPKRWMVVDIDVVLRGGLAYETGAFDKTNISPMTWDTNKVVLSGGLTVGLTDWLRFDTTAGWMFMQNINSTITQNEIRQPQVIDTGDNREATIVGAGKYNMDAFFLGGGVRVLFDGSFREPTKKKPKRRRAAEAAAEAAAAQEGETPDAMPILNAEPEEE